MYYYHCDAPAWKPAEECPVSQTAVHLRDRFRLLWEQHVYWTRMVILGIAFASPDLEASTNRLLRNVPDFEKVLRCFYSNEVAAEFGCLLKEHLIIAAELVKAAKAGDNQAAADAERRWYANADEIVYLLCNINQYWPAKPLREMWHEHLRLTKAEAVATLGKNYAKSVETFDKIEKAALMMADSFSNGIICQFCL